MIPAMIVADAGRMQEEEEDAQPEHYDEAEGPSASSSVKERWVLTSRTGGSIFSSSICEIRQLTDGSSSLQALY